MLQVRRFPDASPKDGLPASDCNSLIGNILHWRKIALYFLLWCECDYLWMPFAKSLSLQIPILINLENLRFELFNSRFLWVLVVVVNTNIKYEYKEQ